MQWCMDKICSNVLKPLDGDVSYTVCVFVFKTVGYCDGHKPFYATDFSSVLSGS